MGLESLLCFVKISQSFRKKVIVNLSPTGSFGVTYRVLLDLHTRGLSGLHMYWCWIFTHGVFGVTYKLVLDLHTRGLSELHTECC